MRAMETPLTPLEFMRRARRLYANRLAVVDGDVRWTYAQFFDRCDRWSAALQGLGVRQGDRVATIAPNTHAQLESFYAAHATEYGGRPLSEVSDEIAARLAAARADAETKALLADLRGRADIRILVDLGARP